MAANEESDPSAILNGFWVTLFSVRKTIFLSGERRLAAGRRRLSHRR